MANQSRQELNWLAYQAPGYTGGGNTLTTAPQLTTTNTQYPLFEISVTELSVSRALSAVEFSPIQSRLGYSLAGHRHDWRLQPDGADLVDSSR